MREVRIQLKLRKFNGDRRSFIAANLAIVFSQLGERTLLIDADLRAKPERGLHALFKLERGLGMFNILTQRTYLDAAQAVPVLSNLAMLPAGDDQADAKIIASHVRAALTSCGPTEPHPDPANHRPCPPHARQRGYGGEVGVK